MKTNTRKLSLLKQLLIYFGLLIAVILGLFYGANVIVYQINERYDLMSTATAIKKQEKLLTSQKYSQVDYTAIFGKGSPAEIVDAEGSPVYSIYQNPISFTAGELECMYDFSDPSDAGTVSYEQNGQEYENITIEYNSHPDDNKVYLVDAAGNVISGNDSSRTSFTATELSYLRQDPGTYGKYEFTASDGKTYYLIAGYDSAILHSYEEAYSMGDRVYLALELLIILTIIAFIIFLSRRITRPLKQLDQAIGDVSSNPSARIKELSGPSEFQSIRSSFNQMADSLQKSDQAREKMEADRIKMLANISHDLKTPITVIEGYTRAIQDGVADEAQQKLYLSAISRKASMMDDLINQFYQYSKLEHPDYTYQKKKTECNEYLREYMASKYPEIELKGMTADIEISESLWYTMLDVNAFRRALDNVIDNALKHNAPGTVIHMQSEIEQQSLLIVIEDTGSGIPPQLKDKIFEPFTVKDESRSAGSSGLGLAISRKIIQDHDGTIELKDAEMPYHTRFEIRLYQNH